MNQLNDKIFIDIETVPGQQPGLKEQIAQTISHPANMKKAETIAAWEENEKPAKVEEAYRRTALDGLHGEVVVIGWAVGDGEIKSVQRGLDEPEEEVLTWFWLEMQKLVEARKRRTGLEWVGHNVIGFDLKFLFQRSVILGIGPTIPLPHPARHGSGAYDTMIAWSGYRDSEKLDNICAALGIQCKEGIDGSKVYDFLLEGRVGEVAEYCRMDVHRVREVYRRMQFMRAVEEGFDEDDFPDIAV